MKPTESLCVYIFEMRKIAKVGDVDAASVIGYIIAGIDDHPNRKVALYSSKTYDELKKMIPVYDTMKAARPKT